MTDKNALAQLVMFVEQQLGPMEWSFNNACVLRATDRITKLDTNEVVRQHRAWMQQHWQWRFAEKQDTSIELSVALALQLAAGQAAVLSGRYIDIEIVRDSLSKG